MTCLATRHLTNLVITSINFLNLLNRKTSFLINLVSYTKSTMVRVSLGVTLGVGKEGGEGGVIN